METIRPPRPPSSVEGIGRTSTRSEVLSGCITRGLIFLAPLNAAALRAIVPASVPVTKSKGVLPPGQSGFNAMHDSTRALSVTAMLSSPL